MSPLYRALRFVGHQHWIPHGRDRFIRLFAPPEGMPDTAFEVDFFGLRYRGNLQNFIDWTVYFYGALAWNELLLMRDIAAWLRGRGERVIGFDVGANVGQHTLFMSLHMDRVVAFEPFELVRRQIEERVALNRRGNVDIVPVALGDDDATHRFFPPVDENLGTGSLVATEARAKGTAPAIEVETRRGDELIRTGGLPVPNVLKIDVEGYEPHVLAGLGETLREARPFILMELLDDTRRAVGDEAGLRRLLYPDAELFEVVDPPGRLDYVLAPLDFDRTFEMLIAPAGTVARMPALAARVRRPS